MCSGWCWGPHGVRFLGTAILVQFPIFTKDILLSNDTVANIFIATFTIGIGAGSLLTTRLLNGQVSAKYVPLVVLLMTVFLIDLYFAAGQAQPQPATTFSGWQRMDLQYARRDLLAGQRMADGRLMSNTQLSK